MRASGLISVLCVWQDNLFAGLPGCAVDHLATGATITPSGARGPGAVRRLPAVLARLGAGKYDLVVLPAVDFRWAYDDSFAKRAVRRVLSAAMRLRPVSAGVNRVLSRRGTRVIVLDRYDSHEPLLDYLRCVTSARRYFKTNLPESDSGRLFPLGRGGACRFEYLPYWIAVENYQVPFQRDRDIDVFWAGTVNSEQRRASIDAVRQLSAEGYRVRVVEGHLPFAEYLHLMSRSWLTLSPQGYGYNGFRHYESMLVGSVPVINRPDPPIVNDFRHGQNCFFYHTAQSDLNEVIRQALADRPRLLHLAEGLRSFVIDHHSTQAVGRYLLRRALEDDRDSAAALPERLRARPALVDACTLAPAGRDEA